MKISLLVLLPIILSVVSNAQVIRYRAFQQNFSSAKVPSDKWENIDVLVVVNLSKKKIHVYTSNEKDFDIISTQRINDNNGGYVDFQTVDQEGNEMEVIFKNRNVHDDPKYVAVMMFTSKDGNVMYRLHSDE